MYHSNAIIGLTQGAWSTWTCPACELFLKMAPMTATFARQYPSHPPPSWHLSSRGAPSCTKRAILIPTLLGPAITTGLQEEVLLP